MRQWLPDIPPPQPRPDQQVTVAVLLPLSGASLNIGQELRNSSELAASDLGNERLLLKYYDTGNTDAEAINAFELAVKDNARLIVGPLTSSATKVIIPYAANGNIPVVSFSNDQSLAERSVFLLGFMPDQQIERITHYAINSNFRHIYMLAPKDSYGELTSKAFKNAVLNRNVHNNKIFFYNNEDDAARIIAQLEHETEIIPKREPIAILVPQGGKQLINIASIVKSRSLGERVQFLGSGQWDDQQIAEYQPLRGGIFASSTPEQRNFFESRYQQKYGSSPQRIASLAYDAVALANFLVRENDFSHNAITNYRGFAGVNGIFRCHKNGICERGLAVLRVGQNQFDVLDGSPQRFK